MPTVYSICDLSYKTTVVYGLIDQFGSLFYIGSTTRDPKVRLDNHKHSAKAKAGKCAKSDAIIKSGFNVSIVEIDKKLFTISRFRGIRSAKAWGNRMEAAYIKSLGCMYELTNVIYNK